MSLQGFLCPLDETKVSFDRCFACPARCIELPILLRMMEEREKKDGVHSCTELLKSPRIAAWERTHDYWLNPFDMVWSLFGTAFHSLVESATNLPFAFPEEIGPPDVGGEFTGRWMFGRWDNISKDIYSFEADNYFEREFNILGRKITLRGTPDQYEHTTDTLTDYKTLKYYYDLMYLWERGDWSGSTYQWQVNMYRRFKFPNCKHMQLVALVKDYNRKLKKEKGITPIVRIAVPWIDDKEIDAFVEKSLTEILTAMDDITKARDCTKEERWFNKTGEPIRCNEFCLVSRARDCPQYKLEEK